MNFYELIKNRRSASHFSSRHVAEEIVDRIVRAGVGLSVRPQKAPLNLVIVSDSKLKRKIRLGAERIERAFQQFSGGNRCTMYKAGGGRENFGWLRPCGNSLKMPFLDEASCLIMVCGKLGQSSRSASVWLAIGRMMLAASDEGLGSICYLPSLTSFLQRSLDVPQGFVPVAIISIGYSDQPARQPDVAENAFRDLMSGRYRWREP